MDFKKLNGIIPAIIQDSKTDRVLMLGFMNPEALAKTRKEGKVTFFSKSLKKLIVDPDWYVTFNVSNIPSAELSSANKLLVFMTNIRQPKFRYGLFGEKDVWSCRF